MFYYSIHVVLNLKLNIGFSIVNVHKPTDGQSFFVLKKTTMGNSPAWLCDLFGLFVLLAVKLK